MWAHARGWSLSLCVCVSALIKELKCVFFSYASSILKSRHSVSSPKISNGLQNLLPQHEKKKKKKKKSHAFIICIVDMWECVCAASFKSVRFESSFVILDYDCVCSRAFLWWSVYARASILCESSKAFLAVNGPRACAIVLN